jgi:hypothetical protein
MVGETWVITIVVLSMNRQAGIDFPTSILRLIRLIKMARMARMARLLRMVPELVFLVKSMTVALRTVGVFIMLWLAMIYIYAVLFKQLAEGEVKEEFFPNVPAAMQTLLLRGVLPNHYHLVKTVSDAQWFFWPLILSFIILACVTGMNMLIGMIVQIVVAVAESEKEKMVVGDTAMKLRDAMRRLTGTSPHEPLPLLSKDQFQKLLSTQEMEEILVPLKVDASIIQGAMHFIYEDAYKEGDDGLSFEGLVETVLDARAKNGSTVKDVKQNTRLIKTEMHVTEDTLKEFFSQHFRRLTNHLDKIKDDLTEDREEDDDEIIEEAERSPAKGVEGTASSALRSTAPAGVTWQLS